MGCFLVEFMLGSNGDLRAIEDVTLSTNRVSSELAGLPRCQAREDLFSIAQMMIDEGFDPEEFRIVDYTGDLTYNIERNGVNTGVDHFSIFNDNGTLIPQYFKLTLSRGLVGYRCKTIKESIKMINGVKR